MNKRDIAIIACRVVALFALLFAIQHGYQMIMVCFIQIQIPSYINFSNFLAIFSFLSPLILASLYICTAFFLWFFADRIAYWICYTSTEEQLEFISLPTLLEWQAIALTVVGIYCVTSAIEQFAEFVMNPVLLEQLARFIMNPNLFGFGLSEIHQYLIPLSVLCILLQILFGLLLIFRRWRISAFFLWVNR